MMYNILISNDDGINAEGIKALTEVAQEFGRVTVVAPERGMSGMSHSVTIATPIMIRRISKSDNLEVVAVNGSPVDCVKVALDYLLDEKPTLMLSGINHGSNSNASAIYSGTMGAAREGAMNGIPAIGFSLTSHNPNEDLSAAKEIVRRVLSEVLPLNKNPRMCLNVNIPTIPLEQIKGMKICRQTQGHWIENFEGRYGSFNQEYVWMLGEFVNDDKNYSDSDQYMLDNNYVSITPIVVDQTDYETLNQLQAQYK